MVGPSGEDVLLDDIRDLPAVRGARRAGRRGRGWGGAWGGQGRAGHGPVNTRKGWCGVRRWDPAPPEGPRIEGELWMPRGVGGEGGRCGGAPGGARMRAMGPSKPSGRGCCTRAWSDARGPHCRSLGRGGGKQGGPGTGRAARSTGGCRGGGAGSKPGGVSSPLQPAHQPPPRPRGYGGRLPRRASWGRRQRRCGP